MRLEESQLTGHVKDGSTEGEEDNGGQQDAYEWLMLERAGNAISCIHRCTWVE